MAGDPYGLRRFVDAQEQANTYEHALDELRAGRKRSHWIWFVFPQIAGLGHSPMARTYAITSLAEAGAYLDHPAFGPRLLECARALLANRGPLGGRDPRRGRRGQAALLDDPVRRGRPERAALPRSPRPLLRRRRGLRDQTTFLNGLPRGARVVTGHAISTATHNHWNCPRDPRALRAGNRLHPDRLGPLDLAARQLWSRGQGLTQPPACWLKPFGRHSCQKASAA